MRFRLCLAAGVLASASAGAATFTVTNTNASGAGSLAQAVADANAAAGADTIQFDVSGAGCDGSGVCTIKVGGTLTLTSPVTIDGFTQSGAAPNTNGSGALNAVLKVVLSAEDVVGVVGFNVETGAAGSVIRGLVMRSGFQNTVRVAAANVAIRGCFLGTDASGMTGAPNIGDIFVSGFDGASAATLGGAGAAERNLIGGRTWFDHVPDGTIQGNLFGTNAAVTANLGAFPNDAMVINPAATGTTVIRGNVVAGGGIEGISVADGGGSPVFFYGNAVGTDPTGTVNFGNPTSGIRLQSNANNVAIGGTGAGEGNVIAFNAGAGIFFYPFGGISAQGCTIRGNSIHSNHQNPQFGEMLGIDLGENQSPLGGLTENDLGDADTGPNGLQNFPIITSAVPGGGSTTITGLLNSAASTTYTLDFYSNPACVDRPQDFLEGRTYLGSTQVTTDASGNAAINAIVPVAIAAGEKVTATATDPDGSTSEFSQRIVVSSSPSSGSPAGVPNVALTGFHFLAGATATVGGASASSVVVSDYNHITLTTPSLPPGSLNDVTVTNTDGSLGTLPNGWIADFLDVPGNHPFYGFVTTLVRNAITVGVGSGNYGVDAPTLRRQMAVFLLKAKHGICYVPPACNGDFADVACPSTFADWIEQMAAEGITGGCGGGNFCPANPVRRDQMAVFLLKAEHGSSYVPPPCSGDFLDVACPSTFADWIEQLAAENITGGCGGGNYCPLSNNTRGQMAVFITKTFGLQ